MKVLYFSFFVLISAPSYSQIQKANVPIGSAEKAGGNLKTTELNDFFSDYPLGINAETLENQFAPIDPCPTSDAPVGIEGLTSGWTLENYELSITAAATVGIISFAEASVSQGKNIYVYDFMYVKKNEDCHSNKITWGAGVRLVITVKKLDASLSLSSLAAFAAAAQLQKSEVNIKMEVIGLSGKKLAGVAPSTGPYDVTRHSEFMAAIDKIKLLAYDSETIVTPQKISLEIQNTFIFNQALIYNHAITNIANKKNYDYALSKLRTPSPQNTELLKTAYKALLDRADSNAITDYEALKVREYMKIGDIID